MAEKSIEACKTAIMLYPYRVEGCKITAECLPQTEDWCTPTEIVDCGLAKELQHIYSCLEHFAMTLTLREDCDPVCVTAFIEVFRRFYTLLLGDFTKLSSIEQRT